MSFSRRQHVQTSTDSMFLLEGKDTMNCSLLTKVVFFLLKEINTFILLGCLTLFESDSRDIYNVTKDSHLK